MINLNLSEVISFFKEIASSKKVQLSAIITFGAALFLVWLQEDNELKIFLTILFLFPACLFAGSVIEGIYLYFRNMFLKHKNWNNLTPEETRFVSYYIDNNTKMRYMTANNGTYKDTGIINPLISKGILYLASNMSEFRGDSYMTAQQMFPINIHDAAFSFFSKKLSIKK